MAKKISKEAQAYLMALEKQRKSQERSTGVRQSDAAVARQQKKMAVNMERSGPSKTASPASKPKRPVAKGRNPIR